MKELTPLTSGEHDPLLCVHLCRPLLASVTPDCAELRPDVLLCVKPVPAATAVAVTVVRHSPQPTL